MSAKPPVIAVINSSPDVVDMLRIWFETEGFVVAGVQSAVAAGCPVVGNVLFVPPAERDERTAALLDAGASVVVGSWDEVADLLPATARPALLTGGADR